MLRIKKASTNGSFSVLFDKINGLLWSAVENKHSTIFRQYIISGFKFFLNSHRTLYGADHTNKLSKQVVARRVYDRAVILLD